MSPHIWHKSPCIHMCSTLPFRHKMRIIGGEIKKHLSGWRGGAFAWGDFEGKLSDIFILFKLTHIYSFIWFI